MNDPVSYEKYDFSKHKMFLFSYINGDVYEGYFKDGLPHGHGMKKEGHFMASVASVYIGEWSSGVKQGYGVIDDIKTGNVFPINYSHFKNLETTKYFDDSRGKVFGILE